MSVMQAGNAESGTMGSNGVVSGSFYNEDSGPDSNVSDEHSFIVLDRETVEDNERKVSELVSSMQSFQFGSAAFTNHFSLVPPVSTVLNGEVGYCFFNLKFRAISFKIELLTVIIFLFSYHLICQMCQVACHPMFSREWIHLFRIILNFKVLTFLK